MSDVLSTLPNWQIGTIAFPVTKWLISSELRHHVHEYPHADGGALEKLGTKLVHAHVTCPFHDSFDNWPNLFPGTPTTGLAGLQAMHDAKSTEDLIIPTVGKIQAVIIKLTRSGSARVRSGEEVEIEFLQDTSSTALPVLVAVSSAADISQKAATLQSLYDAAVAINAFDQNQAAEVQGLFDALKNAVNGLNAIKDTVDLYGNIVASKISMVAGLCSQLDNTLTFNQPSFNAIVDATHDLQAATIKLAMDLQSRAQQVLSYVLPVSMGIAQISQNLYGDTTHQVELLNLNALPDAFNVRAGTLINYYATPG